MTDPAPGRSVLFLLFNLGRDRYALDAGEVAEVLPVVDLKKIPQTPAAIAGAFDYRGSPVPAVDLSQLALGRPAERRMNTRIIVVHYGAAIAAGGRRLLGLVAERVTGTVRRDPADFVPSGVSAGAAPYLGPVAPDPRGVIQRIDVQALLPADVRDRLYAGDRVR